MVKQALIEFWNDESGLTAVEYAIAGGLVVGGMVAAFLTLGENAEANITCLGNAVAGTDAANCTAAESGGGSGT